MEYKILFLFTVIAIEIIALAYLLFMNKNGFGEFSGNILDQKRKTTTHPVSSPFTGEDLYYIDATKENITPSYSCNFLIPGEKIRAMLKPNYSQPFDGCTYRFPYVTNVTINSDGFRDGEFAVTKEPNTFRIVTVGDSLTFGWGVELNESWPKILESILNSQNMSKGFEVLNLGLPTSNIEEKVEFFLLKGLKYNPDMVIIEYNGYQDIFNYTWVKELNEKYKGNITLLSRLIPDYQEMSNEFLDIEINKRVLAMDFRNSRYENFSITFESGIKKPLLKLRNSTNATIIIALFIGGQADENSLEGMEEYGFYVVNVKKHMSQFNQSELVLRSIDFHPSPKAYELIAEFIFEKLIRIL